MTNALQVCFSDGSTGELPHSLRTQSGAVIYPNEDIWAWRDTTVEVSLNFGSLPVSLQLKTSAKQAIAWFVENRSADHARNMFNRLQHFWGFASVTQNPLSTIESAALLSYRATLTRKTEWYLGQLKTLLTKWVGLGIPLISHDTVSLLRQLRLKGNIKGEAVLTFDPQRGPFSDLELEGIQDALTTAFAKQEIDVADYLLIWLFMLLGARTVQYVALKLCDVTVSKASDGSVRYILQLPRAKQRHQVSRTEFKARVLIPQIGELLEEYVAKRITEYSGSGAAMDEPLFVGPSTKLASRAPGFVGHHTRASMALLIKSILTKLRVKSERTGELLAVHARRFRYTTGTRAAQEGHGEMIIAELLDHSSTDNVGVYVKATPAILDRIDKAVAQALAPMAQAFAGVIIRDESAATHANDRSSRVLAPMIDATMQPLANCGKAGFCGLFAPIACYTCKNFEPWLDGPHERVLDHLLSERERLLLVSDKRIASINDRTILAVAEVVRRCAEIRSRKDNGDG